jgi:hypothetical protein
VGRVAFKRGVTPLGGNHVFALPSRIAPFHLPSPLMGSARVAFVLSPRRWSPKTVTTSSMVGRSEPGCGLCPSLSFKDVHHQCWGGECAELGPVSARAAARSFPQ